MMSKELSLNLSKIVDPPQGIIFLLRHGEIRNLKEGKRFIGWQDVALSDVGLAQARKWADYFSAAALKNICCSDLSRCLETARIIGARCSLEPSPFPELREIHLGRWDGQSFETIQSRDPAAFLERGDRIADYRPPGGESFRDLQARVWPVFKKIVQPSSGGPTLIVTHAGVIRVLLCRILGMPLENLFSIGQAHGALNIIAVRPKHWSLQAINLQLI
jgi:alpha-ribazole phosphatase